MSIVSVCMATYNGEKYIKEQVLSILSQLGDKDELIISDDNSTDNTTEIVKDLNDHRIILTHNMRDKGYSENFQNALSIARGDIIFLSDQDDIWMPNKKEVMIEALKNADLAISDAIVVDDNLKVIFNSRTKKYNIKTGFANNLIRTRYIGCCMAFNRSVYDLLIPFPKKVHLCPHDLWITLVGEYFFKSVLISKPLIYYRRHSNNTSLGGEKYDRSISLKIIGRLYCLLELLKVIMRNFFIQK